MDGMWSLYFLLLYLCSGAYCASGDEVREMEMYRQKVLDQMAMTRPVLLEDYHMVTRQVVTNVEMYRNYRSVSVLFYPIMRDAVEARFTFQSEEVHLNNIGSCSPERVIIHLKRGSYPSVNPDGYEFPKNFIDPATREEIYTTEILSDGKLETFIIENPKPGYWYGIAFKEWQDPRTQKVSQEGLVANCATILYTDLQVQRKEDIEGVDCYSGIELDVGRLPAYFKCMSEDNTNPISLNITVVNTTVSSDELLYRVQSLSLPTTDDYIVSCAFDPNSNNIQTISFTPSPSTWHYIQIDQIQNSSRFADCESYYSNDDTEDIDNVTVNDLMRDDKGRFFTFDYGLPTTDIKDVTSLVNLTAGELQTLRFKINPFIDIGGNLIIEASLLMSLKYYMGYKRPMKKGGLLAFTEENQFFRTVICMDIGHASIPTETGHCKYNDQIKPALFILNSTDSDSIYDKTIIPYPETGTWYLSMRLFCDRVVCPCKTSNNGTQYYVELDALAKEGLELSNSTRVGGDNCNGTVVLSISSSACINGRCSNHGNCLLNTFGGLVMSFCSCMPGYGGWDCSDSSRMDSLTAMLVAVLLLTLSNLMFFLSIYVAIIRIYYTEAMMYTFTMVFSTFYHACDAPPQVAFCITRGHILQFADFYCGLMCFWVTLLATSIIGDKLRSSLQLTGAIVIALLTTWNMHSFVSFVLPVALGVLILLVSWCIDYRKTGSMRYPASYYKKYLPIGLVLVAIGLICYAFLQTEQNYKIVHSIWHMLVAASVVFLLPDVKRDGDNNPFLPDKKYYKIPFFFRSRPSITQSESITRQSTQP